MSATVQVSVVIPTYRRCASAERLLHTLTQQTLAPDQYEVILAIDGSEDGTWEMATSFDAPYRLHPVRQPNRGRAAACNTGIQAAQGELVVLLDDDMQPAPTFLAAHLAAHVPDENLGVVGAVPIQVAASSSPVLQYVAEKFNRHLAKLAQPGYRFGLRDFYSGNFSIRRQTLLAVGGFDEGFRLYGNEDIDLSLRLQAAGVTLVYSPQAVAFQSYTKDFTALARDHIAKGQTSVRLVNRHPAALPALKLNTYRQGSRQWRLLRALLLLTSRVWSETPELVSRGVMQLERWRVPHLRLVYDLVLDYCYWHGVQVAEGEAQGTGRRGGTWMGWGGKSRA